jgi:hypothetical protein
MPAFWDVEVRSLVLMMEAETTVETSVYFYDTTWRCVPDTTGTFILAAVRT